MSMEESHVAARKTISPLVRNSAIVGRYPERKCYWSLSTETEADLTGYMR
jgi:hypothetical protein